MFVVGWVVKTTGRQATRASQMIRTKKAKATVEIRDPIEET